MKKILMFISALLLWSACAVAQTTAVTATVVDSDSTVWANAPWSLSFQVGPYQSNPALYTIGGASLDPAVTQQSGAADGSGVITFTVYRSTSVSPIGSSWNLTVCPNASSRCSSFNFSTSGASQNLSSQINAGIIAPRFQAVSGSYGYNDGEALLQLKPASTYWNVTNSVSRCYTGSAWGVCSAGGGALPTATAKGQQLTATAAGITYTAVNPGVINVRTMFGAVPDGSTDNSTAITNAYAVANAMSDKGQPVVYFDCNGATSCQYNYGGAGISPINPTVQMTTHCAQGVILHYTGTAHEVDLGPYSYPGGHNKDDFTNMVIDGCTFSGATTATEGIYANDGIGNLFITNDTWLNDGPTTSPSPTTFWSIFYAGYVSESFILKNNFYGFDGVFRNGAFLKGVSSVLDPQLHNIAYVENNHSSCVDATTGAVCSLPYGTGIEMADSGVIAHNLFGVGDPVIRLHGVTVEVSENHIETNFQQHHMVQFGNTLGNNEDVLCRSIHDNFFFMFGESANVSFIGPSVGSGFSTTLSNCTIQNNVFGEGGPTTTAYVNADEGKNNVWGLNRSGGANDYIPINNSPKPVFGGTFTAAGNSRFSQFSSYPVSGGTVIGNALMAYDANFDSGIAGVMSVSDTLSCLDSSGSLTDKACILTYDKYSYPYFSGLGQATNAMIIFSSSTSNSGALTLNVDNSTVDAVKKQSGGSLVDLAAGDIIANTPYLIMRNAAGQWVLKF